MSTEEGKTTKKKKGNFFSNLLFTSDESDNTVDEAIEEEINVSNSGTQIPASPVQSFNVPITGDGVFDKTFHDAFQELIAENDLEGIDYLEFKKALTQMAASGLNEAISFQTVFTTLQVSADPGLSKKGLSDAIDFYISVLKKEEEEFKSEMNANNEKEVISRRNEAEALNAKNKDLVQQLQNINEEIARNQETALKLNSEAADVEAKIGQTHKNFIATLAHVVANLETDKVKIEQLIK